MVDLDVPNGLVDHTARHQLAVLPDRPGNGAQFGPAKIDNCLTVQRSKAHILAKGLDAVGIIGTALAQQRQTFDGPVGVGDDLAAVLQTAKAQLKPIIRRARGPLFDDDLVKVAASLDQVDGAGVARRARTRGPEVIIVFTSGIANVDLPLREGGGVDRIGRRRQGDVINRCS